MSKRRPHSNTFKQQPVTVHCERCNRLKHCTFVNKAYRCKGCK